MKSDIMHSGAQVDQFILKNLSEVKETVATNLQLEKNSARTFGINDLWDIRRKARLASERTRR